MSNTKLPAGMSQLDYLWTHFGNVTTEPGEGENSIITEKVLQEYLKEYTKGGIIDLKLIPKSEDMLELVATLSNNSTVHIADIDKEDYLISVKNILSTQVEIDNNVCDELDIPLLEFTMKSGKRYYIKVTQYTGVETSSIKTTIKDNRVASHLKLDKSAEISVINAEITEDGLKIDLAINSENKQLKLVKTEEGLSTTYNWKNGDAIEFEVLNFDQYSLIQNPTPGTLYFITDYNCIYLNKIKYGVTSIPVADESSNGLMSKEDKQELKSLREELENTKSEVNRLNDLFTKMTISNITNGGNVTLLEDLYIPDGQLNLTNDSVLDLNSNTLSTKGGTYGDSISIKNGANVTIKNGEITPSDGASQANQSATIMVQSSSASQLTLDNVKVTGIYPLYVNSANENTLVTINSGEFYSTMELNPAVYVGKGTSNSTIGGKVVINGGTFGQKGITSEYLLNVEDILRKQEGKEPRDFIEVFGGKFINFNPANNKAEGANTNFVADGYKVTSTVDGDDTIYTVSKMSEAERYNKIKEGGGFKLNSDFEIPANYALTLTKDVVLDLNGYTISGVGHSTRGDIIEIQKSTVTLKNGTITNPQNSIENDAPVAVMGNSTVTIENMKVYGERCIMSTASNNNITIKSGEFVSPNQTECVYYSAGSNSKIIIEGGRFESKVEPGQTNFTLNIKDQLVTNGVDVRNFIEVRGGEFVNFDPSNCNSEGPGTNFVAEGKTVQILQEGSNKIYKVV